MSDKVASASAEGSCRRLYVVMYGENGGWQPRKIAEECVDYTMYTYTVFLWRCLCVVLRRRAKLYYASTYARIWSAYW